VIQWVIVPLYLARTALSNSAAPLLKSVLMDYTTKVGTAPSR
jgi:hypothetical protein